jgi:hypothetical protein
MTQEESVAAIKLAVFDGAFGASHAMAQAPLLPLIFHGKIRRQSGGRTGLDSAAV